MNSPLALTGWVILASLVAWFVVLVVRGVAEHIKADASLRAMSDEFWVKDCRRSVWRLLWTISVTLFESTAIARRIYRYRLKRTALKYAKRNHWQVTSLEIIEKTTTSEARGRHAE